MSETTLTPEAERVLREKVEAVREQIATLPARETEDYPTLFAWYGSFGMAEHYRSVMRALCAELVRAKFAVRNEKITEARIDDLAHCEDAYLTFLEEHLRGRALWAQECRGLGEVAK